MTGIASINPFYAARLQPRLKRSHVDHVGEPARMPRPADRDPTRWARLPAAPINGSPVPGLTSLYHSAEAGDYGDRGYPGNCGGNLIRDLIRYFRAKSVFDPMTGSGTCRDVCRELDVYCWSSDLHQGVDACEPCDRPAGAFDVAWIHPPYWRMKLYTSDPRDLSRTPTMEAFLQRYRLLIANCAGAIHPGGKVIVLMGDYSDREAGYVPLVYHTKELAFSLGLKQHCTDVIRFSHGNSSSKKVYRSSFIPGLHDVCMIFEKAD
ncbi:TRM11 family methyltransferase [Paludisphaera rhizosphaerae]|uniref:hypothetical protein n=1 Tax=Paludisphaera rhizosphaerae TaxID=2711216 RepID=UPI0013E9FA39|nr:hypothetical protein [Paludisphaera rhizosphaerae]